MPADKSEAFLKALRDELPPATLGLSFRPIKAEQLAAASGGTDFSEYFVYFSFFLIVAAALLMGAALWLAAMLEATPSAHGLVQGGILLALIAAGIAIYGLLLRLFGATSWRETVNAIRQTPSPDLRG